MKNVLSLTLAASLVAGSAASHHNHQHLHAKKHAADFIQPNAVVKRDPAVVTQYVAGPTETVYELGGEILGAEEAKAGLKGGDFVVVGESVPTFSPPPPPPEPTTTAPALGAQFLEVTSSTEAPTTSATPSTSSAPAPAPPKPSPSQSEEEDDDDEGFETGIDADFPSGKYPCSKFPSAWGAVSLDWLNMNHWSGLQYVPGYTKGASSISTIHTGIDESNCEPGTMCSYACPPGYQKAQWTNAQGSDRESIGGLYCNTEGKLELTREASTKLCEKGKGGVWVQNDLDEVVTLCRTDYPGTENMVIPLECGPGDLCEVTNPDQTEFMWDDTPTSAQYYLQKKGYTKEFACKWVVPEDPEAAGNWSPTIIGVGLASDSVTYLSIFANRPMSHADLDFNVEIKGDVNSDCSLVNNKYSDSATGCTTGMAAGGKAIIRYF